MVKITFLSLRFGIIILKNRGFQMSYQIVVNENEIVVHIDRSLVDTSSLEKFLEYLELKNVIKQSQLMPENAEELAQDIKKGMWNKLKKHVEKNS